MVTIPKIGRKYVVNRDGEISSVISPSEHTGIINPDAPTPSQQAVENAVNSLGDAVSGYFDANLPNIIIGVIGLVMVLLAVARLVFSPAALK